jgi:hypothetical protein
LNEKRATDRSIKELELFFHASLDARQGALHEIWAAVRSLNEQEQVFHALGRSPAQSPP